MFVFTPTHTSWLNMIESFFSKMTKQMLKGIRVSSKEELSERIYRYFDEINELLKIEAATTISVVERRTRDLVSELQKRHIHQDVIKCCKEEYLQENYFHAIFEAAKSLSEKVREKTGMQDDGSNLFNNAFAVNNPRLAINSLQTPSERNAQNGLKEMLNGITHMVRNVTAHELKIKWIVNEQDAIDILTTISFFHKQLDECFVVPQHII